MLLGAAVVGYFVTKLMQPFLLEMLTQSCLIRINYCGQPIPVALGLLFLFSTLFCVGLGTVGAVYSSQDALLFLFLLLLLALVGLIDDFLGSRSASGFVGHFYQLFYRKKLTTGALKALLGGACAFWVSFLLNRFISINFFLDGLLLALTINLFNLLDLRPGRAIKFFLLNILVLFLAIKASTKMLMLASFAGSVLAYFPLDLQAKGMMGDTGSNLLGGAVGLFWLWYLPSVYKVVLLILLLFFHFYTEKHSLTKTIAKIAWLKYLDDLGRKGEEKNG